MGLKEWGTDLRGVSWKEGRTPVTMKARFSSGSKYLTVVSRVLGKVFRNSWARSGSRMRFVRSSMTFCSCQSFRSRFRYQNIRHTSTADELKVLHPSLGRMNGTPETVHGALLTLDKGPSEYGPCGTREYGS